MINEKKVLIIGGSGPFGRKMVKTILENYKPSKLIVFSRDEKKQLEMAQIYSPDKYSCLRYFIGDIRDQDRLYEAFKNVDYVIHVASLKQASSIDYNPFEAIKINVLGAQNIIKAAIDQKVRRVIALSTDQAANPLNLYGASKLCADKLFVAGNVMSGDKGTRFSVVRYGDDRGVADVLIPELMKKKAQGVIEIADRRSTYFLFTLQQSVDFVLGCLGIMRGGEIFIPKLPSWKRETIINILAPEAVITEVGLQPHEKLHETLMTLDEARQAIESESCFIIKPGFSWPVSDDQHWIPCQEGFSYASDTNTQWILPEGVKKLIMEFGRPLPYGRQFIDDGDVQSVVEVLKSDWITTGQTIDAFEKEIADFTGASQAVALSSGTAALHAAMYAIGIGPGDEVIVPHMTFAATANAIVFQGGTPVFVDVDRDTLLLNPGLVEEKITPRTKAIVTVDYAGHPSDYDLLRAIAGSRGLVLVADACHALGAVYRGRPVGSLADLSVFSFHPVKHITTGEGGMVTTDSPEYARRMRMFRNHCIDSDHRQRAQKGSWYYEMVDLGYNYRITDFQCALGMSQLKKLPQWLHRRRFIADYYNTAFEKLGAIRPLAVRSGIEHAYHLYVIQLRTENPSPERQRLFTALRDKGIGVNVHYIPVHLHPYYQKVFGTAPGLCPVAEDAYSRILSLPIFSGMQDDEARAVVAVLNHEIGSPAG